MRDYNGHTSAQRTEAQRFLNAQIAAGNIRRPTRCHACGQTDGTIDLHAEDYSYPFAIGKTDEFPLCFTCHMAVHSRFRNVSMWDRYREEIGRGWKLPPIFGRRYPLFIQRFTSSTAEFALLAMAGMGGGAPVPPDYRPLDVIDGWLLAKTGKGWR